MRFVVHVTGPGLSTDYGFRYEADSPPEIGSTIAVKLGGADFELLILKEREIGIYGHNGRDSKAKKILYLTARLSFGEVAKLKPLAESFYNGLGAWAFREID